MKNQNLEKILTLTLIVTFFTAWVMAIKSIPSKADTQKAIYNFLINK